MQSVTIGANCYLSVAECQPLAVHAGLVLGQLICAQRRVVLADESLIRVTAPAEFWDIFTFDLAAEARAFAHGIHVRLRRVTPMATGACQPLLGMNVLGELFRSYLKGWVQSGMAIETRTLSLDKADTQAARPPKKKHGPQCCVISPCSHKLSSPACSPVQRCRHR